MSNPTSNFGWQMPTPTDLVTDLPADFEVFGQAVDSSLADLKGGTTGQVLSKNSNTDMDFVWVTDAAGDITGVTAGTGISGGGTSGTVTITNSMATEITAKGDLIVGTGSATFDNLAAGANGSTLVTDSAATTGLRYQGNYAAGKNAIINGDLTVNQRSFTSTSTSDTYGFDRWFAPLNDGTCTYSAQTFTPGAAPVAGYEASNYARIVTTGQTLTSARAAFTQRIENVRTFAGQTVTISFYAKANTGTPSVSTEFAQNFGTGGSPSASVSAIGVNKIAITTAWVRYSATVAVPSISGKTIGTTANTSYLQFALYVSAGADYNARTNSLGIQSNTFEIWGVQVEAGSVATAFQTATGTLQGELAACQRYYWRQTADATALYAHLGYARGDGATTAIADTPVPVTMRVTPTVVDYSNIGITDGAAVYVPTSVALSANQSNAKFPTMLFSFASGVTQFRFYYIVSNNNAAGYLGLGAEL